MPMLGLGPTYIFNSHFLFKSLRMKEKPMSKRLLIVFVLGFSSGLPLALISSTLQAWFSDTGLSVVMTGMLSLAGLPYVFCTVLSPFLDRYTLLPFGKRRSWIGLMQVLLLIGFNLMAWLSPLDSPKLMAFFAFMLAFCSATQDMAINAHRIEYLSFREHGLGASIGVIGYRLGLLVAGGLALIVAQFAGWAFAYRLMGLFMLPGLVAIYLSPEPSKPLRQYSPFSASFVEPVRELLSRPHIGFLFLFVFFYKLGEAFTTTTSGIMMPFLIQALHFSLDTIAYVNKIIGVVSILAGGIFAGIILKYCSLYRALIGFGLLQAITNLLFVLLATVGHDLTVFILAVVSDNFAAGMGSIALVALFMRLVDNRFTATQFSILVAFSTLPRVFSGPMASYLQSWFGWVGLYQITFVLSLGFIPFLTKIRRQCAVMIDPVRVLSVD